jgi:hypothetical protein
MFQDYVLVSFSMVNMSSWSLVQNQPTLCNIPEDGRIQVNSSGNLQSRKIAEVRPVYKKGYRQEISNYGTKN